MEIKQMPYYGVVFVVLAVILGLGAIIMQNFVLSTYTVTTTSVVNESLNLGAGTVNGTTTTLASYPLDSTALTIIGNGKALSNPQNFTYVAGTGVISWNSSVWGNVTSGGAKWNATYNYNTNVSTTATTVVNNNLSALSTFSSWQNLLAIVIVAVIILFLVIRSLSGQAGEYSGE